MGGRLLNKRTVSIIALFCLCSVAVVNIFTLNSSAISHTLPPKNDINDNDEDRRTLHMMYSVFGDNPAFVDQWEVSLKSILFNAPLDSDLHVHVFCNGVGYAAVRTKVLDVAKLPGTMWRNHIHVTVTNVESHIENLLAFLNSVLIGPANNTTEWMDRRLGIGAFFRLFAYKFMMEYIVVDDNDESSGTSLADDTKHQPHIANDKGIGQRKDLRQVAYLDVDVVIISNLNHLLLKNDELVKKYITEHVPLQPRTKLGPLWFWGQGNSGFLGLNALEFDSFWEAARQCESIKLDQWPKKNDQWLLQHVMKCFPDVLTEHPHPSPWSIHVGHGYRSVPQKLSTEPSRTAGMLHLQNPDVINWFDGPFHRSGIDDSGYGSGYVGHFCKRARGCDHFNGKDMMAVRNTWGLADYFVRISWEWLIYQSGTSRIKPGYGGSKIELVFRDAAVDNDTSFFFAADGTD